MLAVVLAFASSLSWGAADFLGGVQSRRRPLFVVLFCAQLSALALGVLYVVASGDPFPSAEPALLAFGAGLGGCLALAAFYRGLAIGTMSIVAPISATGASVPVLAGVIGGERPSAVQALGIAVALVGVVLAAREPGGKAPSRAVRASIGLALLAALGLGTFLVLLDAAVEEGGAPWPLLIVRFGEVLLLGTVLLVRRPPRPRSVSDAAPLLLIGVLDYLATALFAAATERGLLSVVAVVGSLYPAVTVVLARVLLAERVSRSQEVGVVTTLAAVVAISAG